jgi:hypothetical protein
MKKSGLRGRNFSFCVGVSGASRERSSQEAAGTVSTRLAA